MHSSGNTFITIREHAIFFAQFQSLMSGIIGGISAKKFGKIIIPLYSLPEQARIVAKLDELFSDLDAAEAELKQAKARLEVFRQIIYSIPFDELQQLMPISRFFDVSGGLTKNSHRDSLPIKYPYLRVANVYYNFLDLKEINEIGVSKAEIDKCKLKENDLLFVEGNGSKSQIGRVALWNGFIKNCLHQNHIIKARSNGIISPTFALYYFISLYGRQQILNAAHSTFGIYTLSVNKIKGLKFPYCDTEQQKSVVYEIESKLSKCIAIEQTVDSLLRQIYVLRQSILKQAFEGKL